MLCNEIEVTGHSQKAARYIGLMPDPLGVYTDLSVMEYLDFFTRVLEIPKKVARNRIDEVVDLLELDPWLEAEVETLSAGWQRRLALGRVLLSQAPVLLLDEPAAGLDVSARHELLAIIRKLTQRNHTIVISSHIFPELEELADRFGVLNKGSWVEIRPEKIFLQETNLTWGREDEQWRMGCSNPEKARLTIESLEAEVIETLANGVIFSAKNEHIAAAILRRVGDSEIEVYEFSKQNLELNAVVRKIL